jgi:lipopolysaccharide/colanic/teichoic acid biosynthesis glycosyltransferase/NDP-sugar pyrophosphorylase family protein
MLRDTTAVILLASPGTALFPTGNRILKSELPLANTPVLHYQLSTLARAGIRRVVMSVPPRFAAQRLAIEQVAAAFGVDLSVVTEPLPRGTAGCLRDLRDALNGSPFLVVPPGLLFRPRDLREILVAHREGQNALTVSVRPRSSVDQIESVEVDADDAVRAFHSVHPSVERRRTLTPWGLYVFDPAVLDAIPEGRYFDIKRQLTPELLRRRARIRVHRSSRLLGEITTLPSYLHLNESLLVSGGTPELPLDRRYRQVDVGVWMGDDVRVASTASLTGPIVIGDHCVIGEGARVIGPSAVGDRSEIGARSLVHRAIVLRDTRLAEGSWIEQTLVGHPGPVPAARRRRYSLPPNGDGANGTNGQAGAPTEPSGNGHPEPSGNGHAAPGRAAPIVHDTAPRPRGSPAFERAKRAIDIVVAGAALLCLAPLFPIIAALIRRDSPGPAFFSQRRCGRHGHPFRMYKFRTMVVDAPKLHASLVPLKDVDGPMFKMLDDPRITRIGALLRRTSLDELPQLWNVLKGDMSLVGPRPLVMEEMAYPTSWRDIRLSVKPGLTGLWQVSRASEGRFHDWINLDIAYVNNQSLGLDLKILVQTLRATIRGAGAR